MQYLLSVNILYTDGVSESDIKKHYDTKKKRVQ